MRVLVATHLSNGDRPGDYHHCIEGELVYMQKPCASDVRDPDGPCGCGRGFSGTNSHCATSTAQVREVELSEADVREAFRSSLESGGWLDPAHCSPSFAKAMVEEVLVDVRCVAQHFPVGSVVRRRLDKYFTETPLP